MTQPPSLPFLARSLVRTIPFASQFTAKNAALANLATIVCEFDVAIHSTDNNSFLVGAAPGAGPQIPATGQLLDALVFSSGAGALLVEFAVDLSCTYHQISNSVVPAATATNISGLRVTGRFVRVTFTNNSGGAVSVEFGAYIRSA